MSKILIITLADSEDVGQFKFPEKSFGVNIAVGDMIDLPTDKFHQAVLNPAWQQMRQEIAARREDGRMELK